MFFNRMILFLEKKNQMWTALFSCCEDLLSSRSKQCLLNVMFKVIFHLDSLTVDWFGLSKLSVGNYLVFEVRCVLASNDGFCALQPVVLADFCRR